MQDAKNRDALFISLINDVVTVPRPLPPNEADKQPRTVGKRTVEERAVGHFEHPFVQEGRVPFRLNDSPVKRCVKVNLVQVLASARMEKD